MKNSTLLRLFFISIGIPLASASMLKPKGALTLVDSTNTAPAVQPKTQDTLASSVPEDTLVPELDKALLEKFKTLLDGRKYTRVDMLADGMEKEKFLGYLAQAVSTPDHFAGLYRYLMRRMLVPKFLVYGNMQLVRKVIIAEPKPFEHWNGEWLDSVRDAAILSVRNERHDRAVGLFEADSAKPQFRKDWVKYIAYMFFGRYPLEKDSMPLKRFITLHGEKFNKEHPAIFQAVCRGLVKALRGKFANPNLRKLLDDFIGQSSLLTTSVFVDGFLVDSDTSDDHRASFVKCAWRDAFEEGLKIRFDDRGEKLWWKMVKEHPKHFSGAFPRTDEARRDAVKNFPTTKQGLEEAWALKNPTNSKTMLRAKLLAKLLNELSTAFPTVIWTIIADYAIFPTWLDFE